ncbi:MAG: hypothetical protein SFU86_07410 [Pirellulaceae bacterium]|nr:hypothetical protein [Pirellulaceae bacterium]
MANHSPGVIRPEEIYEVRELRRRMGLGDHAYREARAAGLRVRRLGRKIFVLGEDFIAFVKSRPEENAAASGTNELQGSAPLAVRDY